MLKRSAKIAAGILLLIAGIILTPLPIPFGILCLFIGLSILVSAIPQMRIWVTALRRRYQRTSAKLNLIKHRMPHFARQLIEETDPNR